MSSLYDMKELKTALKVVYKKASFQNISTIIKRNSTFKKKIKELKIIN